MRFVAPAIKEYPPEWQDALRKELDEFRQKAPHMSEAVDDYGNLRAAIRNADK